MSGLYTFIISFKFFITRDIKEEPFILLFPSTADPLRAPAPTASRTSCPSARDQAKVKGRISRVWSPGFSSTNRRRISPGFWLLLAKSPGWTEQGHEASFSNKKTASKKFLDGNTCQHTFTHRNAQAGRHALTHGYTYMLTDTLTDTHVDWHTHTNTHTRWLGHTHTHTYPDEHIQGYTSLLTQTAVPHLKDFRKTARKVSPHLLQSCSLQTVAFRFCL